MPSTRLDEQRAGQDPVLLRPDERLALVEKHPLGERVLDEKVRDVTALVELAYDEPVGGRLVEPDVLELRFSGRIERRIESPPKERTSSASAYGRTPV